MWKKNPHWVKYGENYRAVPVTLRNKVVSVSRNVIYQISLSLSLKYVCAHTYIHTHKCIQDLVLAEKSEI